MGRHILLQKYWGFCNTVSITEKLKQCSFTHVAGAKPILG